MYRMGQEEVDAVAKVLLSKQLFRVGDPKAGHLQEVETFEREWASKVGTEFALLMAGGGTAALVCALAGCGIGPGDEVLVPAYTWMATATTVLTVGAIPVLVEADETLAMDPEDLEVKIGPATRAVMPVHMAGRPANMERILAIARENDLRVIEDSCQMVGGSYKGRRTGSWGDAGAYSLNHFKIISTGEGGVLATNDREIYERAFVYHDSGASFRPMAGELKTPIFVAQQYRADEIMGAIARVQLRRLDGILADLRRVRRRIEEAMRECGGVQMAPSNDPDGDCGVVAAFQFENEKRARAFRSAPGVGGYVGIDHGKHVYTEWIPLIEKRIMHHPDMNPYRFEANRNLRCEITARSCPRTLELLRRTVFVPLHPDVSEEDLARRIDAFRNAAAV